MNKISIQDLLSAFDSALKKHHSEMIHKDWAKKKTTDDHYSFGCCYSSSETIWRLSKKFREANPDMPDLKVCKAEIGDDNHYWLEDRETGKIYDPTAEQFAHGINAGVKGQRLLAALYQRGRGIGIRNLSNRAKLGMEATEKELGIA